jgi:2-polyprenyl-3-methyl-5-hydroxy-6-metoxy-1,4-benzoquinol methylase
LKLRGMTSGKLLEVGCGYGYFLDEAKDFFSFRAGTELSGKTGTHAQQMTGSEIFIGNINTLPSHFKSFDTIVLINVIEHIYAPVEFLQVLLQRLGDNGTIVIATPDIGSFWYTLMKKRWPSFKIPEHVVFYTEKTLFSLLERAGFHKIEKVPFQHAFPLNVIVSKLGIHSQKASCRKSIWLPRTMIALAGRTP